MVRSQDNRNALYAVCSTILIGILVFVWLSAPAAPKSVSLAPGCLNNNPSCDNGLSCINNKCVLACTNDLCPASKSCLNNVCQPAAAVSNLKVAGFDSSTTFSDKFAVGEKRTIESHSVSLESITQPQMLAAPSSAVVSVDDRPYKLDEGKSLTISSNEDELTVVHLYKVIPKTDESTSSTSQNTNPTSITDSIGRQIRIIELLDQQKIDTRDSIIDSSFSSSNQKIVSLQENSAFIELVILKRKKILNPPFCNADFIFYNGTCIKCALQETSSGQITTDQKLNVSNFTFSVVGSEQKTVTIQIALPTEQLNEGVLKSQIRIRSISEIETQEPQTPNQPQSPPPNETVKTILKLVEIEKTQPSPQSSMTVTLSEGQSTVTSIGNALITITVNSVAGQTAQITVSVCQKDNAPKIQEVFGGGLIH